MSEKYEKSWTTYHIPLNSSDNDVLRIGCALFYHFLHTNVKTADCKPMILKMHLELNDSKSTGETAERNVEHNNSINGSRQPVQQLEEKLKAFRNVLLQAKDDVGIDKPSDVDNNATQESNSNKQANNENNLSGERYDTENVASASEAHHMPKEKPEVLDLRYNCVYIENVQCSDLSLEKAFCNVRKLANEMNVEIPDDSLVHIDVNEKLNNYLDYYVYFRDKNIKKEFIKKRHFYVYNPVTSPLRILDYTNWGIVEIKNFPSSDLSLETAYVNVIEIAKKMDIKAYWRLRDYIDHIDVFSAEPNFLTYYVRLKHASIKKEFIRKSDILKQFRETKSLEISDAGGHYTLYFGSINNVSMTVASASVIGMAKLIGLSLVTDNFKRIYVLSHYSGFGGNRLSLIVEFSSKHLKDEFMKKHKLVEMIYSSNSITISDVNAKENFISIKYNYYSECTAISFIGLAKQLGCSLNLDQIQHIFDLSNFIEKACTKFLYQD